MTALTAHRVVWVLLLPRPNGMRPVCTIATPPWWRCLLRQVAPKRRTQGCCYHHRIDWHGVSAAAVEITRQARGEGREPATFFDRLDAFAAGLSKDSRGALIQLLTTGGVEILRDPGDALPYIEGRHRIAVMLEVGVRRTVVIRE